MEYILKQKYYINLNKGAVFIVVLALMGIYDQWENTTAWVYLALHGTYGFAWLIKSQVFPDKNWERKIGIGYGLVNVFGLALYWIAPWLITSQGTEAPNWYLAGCIMMNISGVFLHFATDMQKYTTLKLAPQKLITDGFMARTRNLNYFGELLIYLGFGLLAMHWLPLLVIAAFLVIIWFPNMRKKDRSLGRFPEFEEYRRKTRYFIPFIY
jgi:protein-S-isoprenylcysteine O-methyltransferase Ste14